MKEVESDFQALAKEVLSNIIMVFNNDQMTIINRFFWLWYFRADHRVLESQEIQLNGLTASVGYSKDDEERLEKAGAWFVRGAKVPSRLINGLKIIRYVRHQSLVTKANWVVVDASEGEFIVPDRPRNLIIPLSPQRCLVDAQKGGLIRKENVGVLNTALFRSSDAYVFARRFSSCPYLVSEL